VIAKIGVAGARYGASVWQPTPTVPGVNDVVAATIGWDPDGPDLDRAFRSSCSAAAPGARVRRPAERRRARGV